MMSGIETELTPSDDIIDSLDGTDECSPSSEKQAGDHNYYNKTGCNRHDRDTSSMDSGCDSHFEHSKTDSSGSGEIELAGPEAEVASRRRRSNGEDSDSSEHRREVELLRRRSASVLEVKEHAHTRLREELLRAQKELKLKDEECKKLSRVQDQMSEELEELTATLFEEANNMVQDANVKRMSSEKQLKEAKSKIEVLAAEVTALKTLVITSTPSMPNKHLHPQLVPARAPKPPEFIKGHRRSTSHHNLNKEMRSWDIPSAAALHNKPEDAIKEVDPVYFEEFRQWRLQPSLNQEGTFLSRVIQEDVKPCMAFTDTELAQKVFQCVMSNTLTIEPVHERNPFPKNCSLTHATRICKYRIKLADSEPYYSVCHLARNRIAAVCDFITYIRYITQGLVKNDESGMYWEIVRLRKQMCLSRLGVS